MQVEENSTPEQWVNLTEDGGVQKKIIKKGYGSMPEAGHTVEINYKLTLEDGEVIEQVEDSSFVIGKGIAIKGWDIGIPTMKRFEKAIFLIQPEYAYGKDGFPKLKIPANTPLFYEIELLHTHAPAKKKNEMNLKEKLTRSTTLKDQGNMYFKEKQYYEAVQKYKEGLELLYGEGLSNEARELMLTINLNICNCMNQLGYYDQTIERMDFSLKLRTDHPKIYYYRGIAYANVGKLEEAEKDYDKLFTLVPMNDPALSNLKIIIDQKQPKRVNTSETGSNLYKCFRMGQMYDGIEKEKEKKRETGSDDETSPEPVNRIKLWD